MSKDDDSTTFYDLGLCQEMVDAAKTANWVFPTPIQAKTIPIAIEGKDVCGMAETGSGKTGAFVLPILHHLLEHKTPIFALILEPTHELVLQVADVCRNMGESIGVKVCSILGGVDSRSQVAVLKKKPHIIIATTGRLNQIFRENPDLNFKTIKVLVFDEADKMLSSSFFDEIKTILSRIGTGHQSLLFSATMPDEIETLARLSLNDPVTIELNKRNKVASTLMEYFVVSPTNYKEAVLYNLIKESNDTTSVVFTGTCKTAQIIAKMLQTLHISAVLYHGNLPQKQRVKAFQQFKEGKFSVMVATNVASRGLDIPHVDTVYNYDLPTKFEEYVHRVGRTGRAARCGMAITILTTNDLPYYLKLEEFLGKKLQRKMIDENVIYSIGEEVEQARKLSNEAYKEYTKKKSQKLKEKYKKQ